MFKLQGDRYCTTTLSNLGEVTLPEEMRPFVSRIDFLLGVPYQNPVIGACVSYGGTLHITFSRTIREAFVERAFFTALIKMGIPCRWRAISGERATASAGESAKRKCKVIGF